MVNHEPSRLARQQQLCHGHVNKRERVAPGIEKLRRAQASAANASQLLSPVGMQCLLTPVHLLALNMYNVPIATPAQRASQVGPLLPSSTLARMGRFGCAYGIGGIMNTRLTIAAREWAVRAYAPEN